MNLREILDAFVAVETGLAITDPYPITLKRVYRLLAPNSPETPCTMHQYRRLTASRAVGVRLDAYMIRVYLLIGSALVEPHIKSDIAAAFDEAIIEAFDADIMLGSDSTFQRITDEAAELQPTPIDWLGNGQAYVGCWWDYRVSANVVGAFS